MKIASGMPKPMCASQTETKVPLQADVAVDLQQRHQRHLEGHDQQTDDDDEEDVPAGELHEGERVGRERGDEDRDDRRRQADDEAVDERLAMPPSSISTWL